MAAVNRPRNRGALPADLHMAIILALVSRCRYGFENVHRRCRSELSFLFLCRTIARQRPILRTRSRSIQEPSTLSQRGACRSSADDPRLLSPRRSPNGCVIAKWSSPNGGAREVCLRRHQPARRLLFSHFLAFSEDKLSRPRFVLAWGLDDRQACSSEIVGLFERCSAPSWTKLRTGHLPASHGR